MPSAPVEVLVEKKQLKDKFSNREQRKFESVQKRQTEVAAEIAKKRLKKEADLFGVSSLLFFDNLKIENELNTKLLFIVV